MRLSASQKETIVQRVAELAGSAARTIVFGSRVREDAFGGDIDLLIETPEQLPLATELKLIAQLEQELGCPVDVVTTFPAQHSKPILIGNNVQRL